MKHNDTHYDNDVDYELLDDDYELLDDDDITEEEYSIVDEDYDLVDLDDDDYDDYDDDETVTLEQSVIDSVQAAGDSISPEDRATVHLAIKYARQIDTGTQSPDEQIVMKSLYLGPQLLSALKELRITPASRIEELGKNPKVYAESAAERARVRAEERKKNRESNK